MGWCQRLRSRAWCIEGVEQQPAAVTGQKPLGGPLPLRGPLPGFQFSEKCPGSKEAEALGLEGSVPVYSFLE